MPFIPPFRRQMVEVEGPANAGEFCYTLYRDILREVDGAKSFQKFAEVLGSIEAAKLEFYRNVVAPYEEKKKLENGDVF